MKNAFLLVLSIIILLSCGQKAGEKNKFSIHGTLSGEYSGKVYLYKRDSGQWIKLDSVNVDQGMFHFSGNMTLPEIRYIGLETSKRYASLFIEPSEIIFSADIEDFVNATITGSETQAEYESFKQSRNQLERKLEQIWQKISNAAEDKTDSIPFWEKEYDKADEDLKQFVLEYARNNKSSVVAAYIVLSNSYYYDETDLEPVVNNFDPAIQESMYVKRLIERIDVLKKVAVGQPAVDFSMADTAGNPMSLSSLYGKYLLVDFWASWCGPCRAENPNIVRAYAAYKEKGFDILGVSFDKDRTKWIEAIHADGLTWHHVGDLKYWDNAAGKLYGINSIPSSILLDPQGTIIAKNLRGEELLKKLEELLVK